MPNRILREGYLDSERIRKAGEPAEVLFARLVLVADDFGRFDGRATVICRRCWPNGGPDEIDVLNRLGALTTHGLVVAYESDGKPFIYIPKFKQRTRASKSKYPDPPAGCPQEAPPTTVTGQPNDGHASDSRARSSSFDVRNSGSARGQMPDNPTSTPKAAAQSVAKAAAQIEEQRTWTPTPMPEALKPKRKSQPESFE